LEADSNTDVFLPENFPQAVQDYSSALSIKQALLPPSSRALASVHYQLATVLEFTPNRRSDALSHVEKALEGFKARLSELSGDVTAGDEVSKLSDKDKEAEKKDVQALLGDLEVKIEELKAAPPAEDIVSESINHLLGQPSSSGGAGAGVPAQPDNAPVNDLTGMVKKKKKPAAAPVPTTTTTNGEEAANGKRKAEEEVGGEEKKAKAAE
jgi:HAT1-interacting factor 1